MKKPKENPMEMTVEKAGEVTVVRFPEPMLGADNAADFRSDMEPLLEQGASVLLDLGGVEFIDSTGLGAIITCLKQLKARQGRMKLCCMTPEVRTIFELVGMQKIFDIHDTREEAIRSFAPRSP